MNIFLTTLGLRDLIPIFRSEKIDAHVLQYLEDDDLKVKSITSFKNVLFNENSFVHMSKVIYLSSSFSGYVDSSRFTKEDYESNSRKKT